MRVNLAIRHTDNEREGDATHPSQYRRGINWLCDTMHVGATGLVLAFVTST
jgi:hypothetical protein